MKTVIIFVLSCLAMPSFAADALSHGPQPWTLTVTAPRDLNDLTIPFAVPFITAPLCTPQITSRPNAHVEVVAVSRNFVTVRGDLRKDDALYLSCHMNVTRRSKDPDAVYQR